jgi:hypothetical protein
MQANNETTGTPLYWRIETIIDPGTTTDEDGKTVREPKPYIPSFLTKATPDEMKRYLRARSTILKMKHGAKGRLDELDNTDDEWNPALYAKYDTELTDDMEFTASVTLVATIQPFQDIRELIHTPPITGKSAADRVTAQFDTLHDDEQSRIRYKDVVNLVTYINTAPRATDDKEIREALLMIAQHNQEDEELDREEYLAGLDDREAMVTEREELDAMGRSHPDYWTNEAGEPRLG